MYTWRITKYNPLYRNSSGDYTNQEWTSYSDIGKHFGGKQFNFEDYIEIENKYISTVLQFMNCLHLQEIEIRELEKYETDISYDENIDREMSNLLKNIKDKATINIAVVPHLCKLILREHLWGKLVVNSTLYIHFGYDYYMYIGSSKKCDMVLEKVSHNGLYIEECQSPYQGE